MATFWPPLCDLTTRVVAIRGWKEVVWFPRTFMWYTGGSDIAVVVVNFWMTLYLLATVVELGLAVVPRKEAFTVLSASAGPIRLAVCFAFSKLLQQYPNSTAVFSNLVRWQYARGDGCLSHFAAIYKFNGKTSKSWHVCIQTRSREGSPKQCSKVFKNMQSEWRLDFVYFTFNIMDTSTGHFVT